MRKKSTRKSEKKKMADALAGQNWSARAKVSTLSNMFCMQRRD